MVKIDNKELLLKLGMKEALLDKLDSSIIENLAIYVLDNHKQDKLLNSAIQIASLEVQGKHGAAYLVANELATISQIKNIQKELVLEFAEDHKFHGDDAITIKGIKELLIMSQQETLYTKTNGYKGEFFIDPRSDD